MTSIFIACALLLFGIEDNNSVSESHSLTITVQNLRSLNGELEIGLYNNAEKFPKVGETFKMVRLRVNKLEMTYEFTNLKPGNYAICIYHDENSNKTCDKNIIGIPVEGYAFSNNIKPKLSAPSFKDCAVMLNENKIFTVKMVY